MTGRDDQGRPIGMTVNSMASLSLQPPLLLWSIARHSRNHAAFAAAGHFAVHVLHLGQAELSRRFHDRDAERFTGLDLAIGRAACPCWANIWRVSNAKRRIASKLATIAC